MDLESSIESVKRGKLTAANSVLGLFSNSSFRDVALVFDSIYLSEMSAVAICGMPSDLLNIASRWNVSPRDETETVHAAQLISSTFDTGQVGTGASSRGVRYEVINAYKVGSTSSVIIVLLITPPMTTVASGR